MVASNAKSGGAAELRYLGTCFFTIIENFPVFVTAMLGLAIGILKSSSARRIIDVWKDENPDFMRSLCIMKNGRAKFVFWQRRCYDHNCRTAEDVREKINYCHVNPVRAGLVSNLADWKWSSYGWYQGERDAVLEVDPFEA